MDIYLLKLVGNWISVLFVSLLSLFGVNNYQEVTTNIENTSYTDPVSVVNKIIPYETEYVTNTSLEEGTSRVIQGGTDGKVVETYKITLNN